MGPRIRAGRASLSSLDNLLDGELKAPNDDLANLLLPLEDLAASLVDFARVLPVDLALVLFVDLALALDLVLALALAFLWGRFLQRLKRLFVHLRVDVLEQITDGP